MPPDDTKPDNRGYVLPSQNRVIQPLPTSQPPADNAAVDLIRQKLHTIFTDEPPAEIEQQEAMQAAHRSKYQEYMFQLTSSGKSLADIQEAWRIYYEQLPDAEKHQVWQEFYNTSALSKAKDYRAPHSAFGASVEDAKIAAHGVTNAQRAVTDSFGLPKSDTAVAADPMYNLPARQQVNLDKLAVPADQLRSSLPVAELAKTNHHQPVAHQIEHEQQPAPQVTLPKRSSQATVLEIREDLLKKVRSRNRPTHKQHSQSLIFGLSMGLVMLAVLSFGFFNERFIAPFITPSRAVSSTPLIIDPATAAVGSDPQIIIPKINVEIPVVYDVPTIEESAVQEGLERGVVHYATTPLPGEKGNGVIFGHSANNILNKGKYKFAFVLLRKLDVNDTFYIQKDGKRFVYRIYEKKIVPPTDLSVLNPTDKPATFTLITCDPPGTSLNRLVIVGEQISPDPNANVASTVKQENLQPQSLPSNSPTLWSRFTGLFGD